MNKQEKNVEIALMLGYKNHMSTSHAGMRLWRDCSDNHIGEDGHLSFDSNANSQFDAIDHVENLGYKVNICLMRCVISENSIVDKKFKDIIKSSLFSKKTAIFEALYDFSQYAKSKNFIRKENPRYKIMGPSGEYEDCLIPGETIELTKMADGSYRYYPFEKNDTIWIDESYMKQRPLTYQKI